MEDKEAIAELKALQNYILQDAPTKIAVLAEAHFKEAFLNEGLDGNKWAPRKTKRKGSTNNQPILSKSGELKNQVKATAEGQNVIVRNDVDYAQIHNEGGTIKYPARERIVAHKKYAKGKNKGKTLFHRNNAKATFAKKVTGQAYEVTMPKRQFIGESKELDKKIDEKLFKDMDKIVNNS